MKVGSVVDMMESQDEGIIRVLEDLLREEDILATMVARKNLEGTMPDSSKFKIKDIDVWQLLQKTMNEFFDIITQFSRFGLDKIYFEMGNYEVIFFVIHGDIALVCVVPTFANRGLLEVEIENARRDVKRILNL